MQSDLSGTGCSLGIGNHSLQASSPGGPGAVWMGEGRREGEFALRLINLNICVPKWDAKCWLAHF